MFLEPDFKVESNNETGKGRADISVYALRENDLNVIMEFKYIDSDADDNKKELLSKADEALKQIKDKEYYAKMKGEVLMLGIAHDKKEVEIKHEVINV